MGWGLGFGGGGFRFGVGVWGLGWRASCRKPQTPQFNAIVPKGPPSPPRPTPVCDDAAVTPVLLAPVVSDSTKAHETPQNRLSSEGSSV